MKRSALLISLAVFLLAGSTLTFAYRNQPVQSAENRFALVIGNNAYPESPLKNPVNDATSMAAALKNLGFKVDLILNADKKTIEKAIDSFIKKLTPGRVALFYYAGHGMQIEGENYLIPTDFSSVDEVEAKYSSYSASRLLERLEYGNNGLNIIILDACRNNPFRSIRSSSRGLAIMKSEQGTFIAFATAPGRVADDNPSGSNGLFTSYLIQTLNEPGLTLDQLFGRVREKVALASQRQQVPWVSTSVIGEFYFNNTGVPPSSVSHVQSQVTSGSSTNPRLSMHKQAVRKIYEGPKNSKSSFDLARGDSVWPKFRAASISQTDDIKEKVKDIKKQSDSHKFNEWFFYHLKDNKRLLLSWEEVWTHKLAWLVVERRGLHWWYMKDDGDWTQVVDGQTALSSWSINNNDITIALRLPSKGKGWHSQDIRYKFQFVRLLQPK